MRISSLADRGRGAQFWAGLACAAVLVLTTACHRPRETRSVHLPLAVGNRWVYDVESDTNNGSATIEVAHQYKESYGLSVSGEFGHLTEPGSVLHVRSRDSVLWLLRDVARGTWWYSILSDDTEEDSCTRTLLLYREPYGSQFGSQPIGTVVVGTDTFRDCLRLTCLHVYEGTVFLGGGGDSTWVREDYAPGVGIVRLEVKRHWWSWWWFPLSYSDSGSWFDRWELRDYSLAD